MEDDTEACPIVRSAKSSADFANVLSAAGGFLIGWPLGTAIGGGDPNWTMAGIGAGVVAIAIPLAVSASNKYLQAVEIYNSHLESPGVGSIERIEFGPSSYGIGLIVRF